MNCRFCDIIKGEYRYSNIDKPYYENDDFITIASIGALIEGWTLIVPKNHQFSMKNLYASDQLKNLMNFIVPLLSKKYGKLILFEHGANKKGSITSCGTDHAHLHLVPFQGSLLPKMKSEMDWINIKVSDIETFVGDSEYLFYYEINNNKEWCDLSGYLHILNKPISQYFRKLIAEHIGEITKYDYKLFPNYEISEATNRELLKLCAS